MHRLFSVGVEQRDKISDKNFQKEYLGRDHIIRIVINFFISLSADSFLREFNLEFKCLIYA